MNHFAFLYVIMHYFDNINVKLVCVKLHNRSCFMGIVNMDIHIEFSFCFSFSVVLSIPLFFLSPVVGLFSGVGVVDLMPSSTFFKTGHIMPSSTFFKTVRVSA